MIPIKRSLLYIFRGSLLRLRISWNHGQTLTLSVGYHVDRCDNKGKQKWDGSRCVRNTTHGKDEVPASIINKTLENLEARIDNAFMTFEIQDAMPSPAELKAVLKGEDKKPERKKSFFEAYDDFLAEGKNLLQWAPSTVKKLSTFRKLLYKFNPHLGFDDVTADMMKRLMSYQTTHAVAEKSKKEEESGKEIIKYKGKYQNDTINRNIKYLKWFMKWAAEKGIHENRDYETFRKKYKTTKRPVIFLTWDELMRVLNLDLSLREELGKVRDMFCFCCFTSLRFSDLINLRWSNIRGNEIYVTTIKTTDSIIIDLNKYSSAILDKYRHDGVKKSDRVFDSKSSQKMNVRLKELGKLAGIDTMINLVEMYGSERKEISVPKYQLLSTHCGRRTFICNALSMGIPPNVVMKWTGHSDYKAMQPYIEISDRVRKESMDKFNQ